MSSSRTLRFAPNIALRLLNACVALTTNNIYFSLTDEVLFPPFLGRDFINVLGSAWPLAAFPPLQSYFGLSRTPYILNCTSSRRLPKNMTHTLYLNQSQSYSRGAFFCILTSQTG